MDMDLVLARDGAGWAVPWEIALWRSASEYSVDRGGPIRGETVSWDCSTDELKMERFTRLKLRLQHRVQTCAGTSADKHRPSQWEATCERPASR